MATVFFASCGVTGDGDPAGQPIVERGQSPKITAIFKDHVYDLSGYADESKGDPFNLFDENSLVDPQSGLTGQTPYIPQTGPQPRLRPEIYFPKGRGSRIVTDLQVGYRLSDVYVYDRSHTADSVWIYTGEMGHWKQRASFVTHGEAGLWGWRKFALGDSARYVMIRFNSYDENLTEMVLYGTPCGPVPSPSPDSYAGPRLPKKSMKQFLGANYFNEADPKWVRPFYYSRMYAMNSYFDDDTVHEYPDNQYNMRRFGFWNTGIGEYSYFMGDLQKVNGAKTWYSVRGVPLWMEHKNFTDKDRPVTLPGMDPENPSSYGRHAALMWHLAAFFGNTKVDTNRLSLSHAPRRSGLGLMSLFENGNEEDAWWVGDKYCSPLEYFAQSSADYDGAEGALGDKAGILKADPGSSLMTSGMIGLDTNRVKVYRFLCNTLRKDQAFLWKGGIQYHYYCTNGKHALSPEEDSLRSKLTRVRDFTYRMAPGVDCILGENGYDKGQGERQAVPIIPGTTAAQSQGIMILRSINATAFSGFDSYILYWLRDYDPETDPRVYLTSGVMRVISDGNVKYYPGWYYISTLYNRLGDYVPDEIISEKDGVWIYKYRHSSLPDSVAYFIYSPTREGKRLGQYAFKPGKTVKGGIEQVEFTDDSPMGKASPLALQNGVVTVDVEEKPRLLMMKEEGM